MSITFVHVAGVHAYRDQAFSATVTSNSSPCYGTVVLSVCNVGVLWPNVRWMDQVSKMLHGTEVGLGPRGIGLDGDCSSPRERGTAASHFSAHFALARSPISAIIELLLDR